VTLVKQPFGATFTFSRSIAAPYRDFEGTVQIAAPNIARFDHDAAHVLKGILVEPGPGFGQHDNLASVAGWDVGLVEATVLHSYEADGEIRNVAFYTRSAKAMVDACLRVAGHHREIKVVDGFLRNRGGYVRNDRRNWQLGSAIATAPGPLPSPVLADQAGRPLIEG
jgi:hypothetical protein